MKALGTLLGFAAGAAVGMAAGVLFAPDKGEETRKRICMKLKEKGLNVNCSKIDQLVDQIAAQIKTEVEGK